jgi:menaquinone-dependent protoporphyrinogen oxidase
MNQETTPAQDAARKPISRRDFLKTGCIGASAVGVTVCGIGAMIPAPEQAPVELPGHTTGTGTTNKRVLIAYASYAGSTAEVAAEIGKIMGERGFSVDVWPVKEYPPVEGYAAVLIGSAVHYGQWLEEAVGFIKTNQEALRRLPVSLFTVHITHLEDSEENRKYCLSVLDPVRPLVQPASEAYFAGRFDRRGAALLLPALIAKFIPPMDKRNWDKIRGWAEEVSIKL